MTDNDDPVKVTVCCATRIFFVARPGSGGGNCHAEPPTAFPTFGPPTPLSNGQPVMIIRAEFAPVLDSSWCRLHQAFGLGGIKSSVIDERLAAPPEGNG